MADAIGKFSIRLKDGSYVAYASEMGGPGALPSCPNLKVVVKGESITDVRLTCRIDGTFIHQGFVNPLQRLAITSADVDKVGISLSPAPSPTIVQISSSQAETDYERNFPSRVAPTFLKPFLVVITRPHGALNRPYKLLCWAIVVNATTRNTFTNIVNSPTGRDWTVILFSAYTGETSGGFTGHSAIQS